MPGFAGSWLTRPMPPDPLVSPYFDTAARTERLQLLLHLARNAIDPVYLRAPAGGGKRRLLDALTGQLGDEFALVRLDADEPVKPVASFLRQLDLPPEAADRWPSGLLEALGDRHVLVVVLHADALDDAMRQPLAALKGSGVRMLLAGEGDGVAGWAVQFVDLPPFDLAESATFLRQRAGPAAPRITDDVVAATYATTQGWPGGLLEALEGLLGSSVAPATGRSLTGTQSPADTPADPPASPAAGLPGDGTASSAPRHRDVQAPQPMSADKLLRQNIVPLWAWVGGGALAAVLLAVLVFQDAINAVLEPPTVTSGTPLALPEPTAPAQSAPDPTPQLPESETVPPIALPELTQPADASGKADESGAAEAVESLMPPLDRLEQELQPAAGSAEAGPDPLELVMQDAIAAEEPPRPATPESGDTASAPPGIDAPAPAVPDVQETAGRADAGAVAQPDPVAPSPERPPPAQESVPEVAADTAMLPATVPAPVEDRSRPASAAVAAGDAIHAAAGGCPRPGFRGEIRTSS